MAFQQPEAIDIEHVIRRRLRHIAQLHGRCADPLGFTDTETELLEDGMQSASALVRARIASVFAIDWRVWALDKLNSQETNVPRNVLAPASPQCTVNSPRSSWRSRRTWSISRSVLSSGMVSR